jgi:uncharacterized protein YxjI
VQPKPTRSTEEIKDIKGKKFSKIRMKLAVDDYKECVKNNDPNSIAHFVNKCLASNNDWHPISAENAKKCRSKEEEPNARVVTHVSKLLDNLLTQDMLGTKRYDVPTIMIICPDTYNVVDLNKLLVEKFKDLSG